MKKWFGAAVVALMSMGATEAGEVGDRLAQSLYDGTIADLTATAGEACAGGEGDACFAIGLSEIIGAYETFAQGLYRHGATAPDSSALSLLLGVGLDTPAAPANPNPEPLSYEQFRTMLEDFSGKLDDASDFMKQAGEGSDFVIHIDPLQVRIDFDGDGEASEIETLGVLLNGAGEFLDLPTPDAPPSGKVKNKDGASPDNTVIGFDNADAIWFAGYARITATPVEVTLAHDFSEFFDSYFHRLFPKAGLPMQDYSRGLGTLMMDADSDAFIADIVAAIHTLDFPVIDQPRLAAVLNRFKSITALSRQNWQMILSETDDDRELLPSPTQTSLVPDQQVTQEIVDAWLAALDSVDRIVDGELLIPHWRFEQGFNLKRFFETATETDLVMLFTGQGALPYIEEGPVADAESFAELNRVMGEEWPMFAIWFN